MSHIEETVPLLGTTDNSTQVHANQRSTDGVLFSIGVASLLTLMISTWTIMLTNNPGNLSYFGFHPPLQSLAVLLFGAGILTLQPTSKSDPDGKRNGLRRHQIFNFGLGLPFIIAGSTLMFVNKQLHGAPHFTTWHSTFGAISFVWVIVQVIIGAASAWFGGAAFGGESNAKRVYKYHRLSGYLLLVSLLFTAGLAGIWSDWVVQHTSKVLRVAVYGIAPFFAIVAVFLRIRPHKLGV
ncbi:hypothetical protein BD410DRAFT_788002 [Rickenella mellea]|uniref:Cytochrome b561 domain-containing protein n=1 Tax=Rickenella mellea TaxID=50990 RepID=A0A4Y7Q5M8_9AGAM|nr:hypothetical protein BD410DRAFT_788002 [Rickenella mellea]